MNAVILSLGDELMTGATVDTHSAWLSRRLLDVGVTVVRHVTVGDDPERIRQAILSAAAEAEVVIATGGLGPTVDDLSRQGLAAAMGVPLREDGRSYQRISAFFAKINRPMTPSNRVQASVPEGAEALDNECGTAPGLAGRVGHARVFILPGPPHEMTDMFERQVLPRLDVSGCVVRRALHTFGAGESAVGERIADLMARGRRPMVGTTVSGGVISVRIVAEGATPREARALADRDACEVRRRLGEIIFGQDDETLPSVVGAALAEAGATLAVAESCTGGMLGELITTVPGSSRYFLGGVVAYANGVKQRQLGVPGEVLSAHGAVSEPVASAMARGAHERLGADWGVAITGIAGPEGGSPEKPVGLIFIAVDGPGLKSPAVYRYLFPGERGFVRRRTCLAALNHLRLLLRQTGKS